MRRSRVNVIWTEDGLLERIIHNRRVADYKEHVDALASLMEEFRLREASLTIEGFSITFKTRAPASSTVESAQDPSDGELVSAPAPPVEAVQQGSPVTSPMNGIFYASPSPSSPPFVRIGDTVTAGQVIALIEAMKVFNEIPCPVSGTVLKFVAEPGSIVQPGDVLLWVG